MNLRVGKELLRFASIGAQMAVRKVFGRDDGERFLQNTLSGMPGAPAKIGQLLGMRDASDIPSPEPMPIEDIKAIIARESPLLAEAIESLSEWSKTASLGQTHQALLRSGERVAIKVQYPDVAVSLAAQIDAIFGVAGLSPARNYEFDVGATKKFIGQKLLEETDYRVEALTQNRFYSRYKGAAIVIPKVYGEYSTSKILTQSWEDSVPLADVKGSLGYGECCKAAAIFSAFVVDSTFGLGLVHTDLNPGNYGFRVDGDNVQVVLYDFGSAYTLGPNQGILLYYWLEATRGGDPAAILSSLEAIGFSGRRLAPIAAKLPALSQLLLKPLLTESYWSAEDWMLAEGMDSILGADKWWFRTAGPPWFMYYMRTIQGWHHAMMALGASVNLAKIWWPWEQQIKNMAMFMRRSSPAPVAVSKTTGDGIELTATHLRVLVTEGGEEIVDLSLPARAIEDLEDLLPENITQKCAADGIDLIAIKQKAIATGGEPQDLFTASHGKRQYRVWLL